MYRHGLLQEPVPDRVFLNPKFAAAKPNPIAILQKCQSGLDSHAHTLGRIGLPKMHDLHWGFGSSEDLPSPRITRHSSATLQCSIVRNDPSTPRMHLKHAKLFYLLKAAAAPDSFGGASRFDKHE